MKKQILYKSKQLLSAINAAAAQSPFRERSFLLNEDKSVWEEWNVQTALSDTLKESRGEAGHPAPSCACNNIRLQVRSIGLKYNRSLRDSKCFVIISSLKAQNLSCYTLASYWNIKVDNRLKKKKGKKIIQAAYQMYKAPGGCIRPQELITFVLIMLIP